VPASAFELGGRGGERLVLGAELPGALARLGWVARNRRMRLWAPGRAKAARWLAGSHLVGPARRGLGVAVDAVADGDGGAPGEGSRGAARGTRRLGTRVERPSGRTIVAAAGHEKFVSIRG
jgi:hypothetical protein